jgi:RNA polymerase sigma factor (TIGR02999 family)
MRKTAGRVDTSLQEKSRKLIRGKQQAMAEVDEPGQPDVTRLLNLAFTGDQEALDQVLPLVYSELRRIARRQLYRERQARDIDATALVHEAYVKLRGPAELRCENRAHFLALASRVMRQILVDAARQRKAEKRGGEWHQTTITGKDRGFRMPLEDLLALEKALGRLEALDQRLVRVVECRFYAGMTDDETAQVLGVSSKTVQRDWIRARAWLYKEIYPLDTGTTGGQ